MALPYLVKHIYNNGTDEVIRRGKKIYASGYAELIEHDDLLNTAIFRIRDDAYATYYKVHITKFRDPKTISVRCGCPYNLGEICRHEAAALFQLQEMLDKNLLGEKQLKYDQRHTVVKMKLLELKLIKSASGLEVDATLDLLESVMQGGAHDDVVAFALPSAMSREQLQALSGAVIQHTEESTR